MFSKPEYSLSVTLPPPTKNISLPARLGTFWTREEGNQTILTFNEVKGPKELKDIAQVIAKASWAQTRPRPVFAVRTLCYNSAGKRAPHWDEDQYSGSAKVVVDNCNVQIAIRKRSSKNSMPTPNFNVTVEYAAKHYFNGGDEVLSKVLKQDAGGGGMGMGLRDNNYDFASTKQVEKALADLSSRTKIPFPVKVYISQNVYDGRARWVLSNDVVNNQRPDKALEKFKALVALSPAR